MYSVFVELMQERGVTPYQVSKATGIAQSTLSGWKISNRQPQTRTLKKLADYFGVSVQYLEGKTKDRGQKKKPAPVSGDELSAEARTIGAAFDASVPELRAAIKALLSRGEAPKLLEEDIKITCPLNQREQVIRQPYYLVGGKRMAVLNNGCENCHQCQECELCQARVMRKISE